MARVCGLEPAGLRTVGIGELHVQYRHERRISYQLFTDENYRTLIKSPLFDLLEVYSDRGMGYITQNYRDTTYYRMFRSFDQAGCLVDWTTGKKAPYAINDEQIFEKIRGFLETYHTVKDQGYLGGRFANRYVTVLEAPYEVYRRSLPIAWRPYEIWGGHHRAAALAVLGYSDVEVLLFRWVGVGQAG